MEREIEATLNTFFSQFGLNDNTTSKPLNIKKVHGFEQTPPTPFGTPS
jgi:hypothetical protein